MGVVLIGNRAFNHCPSLLITLALINGRKVMSLRSFTLPLHYFSLSLYMLSVSYFLFRFILWILLCCITFWLAWGLDAPGPDCRLVLAGIYEDPPRSEPFGDDWCFCPFLFTAVLVPDPLLFPRDLSGVKLDVASVHHFDYVDRIVRLGGGPDLWR